MTVRVLMIIGRLGQLTAGAAGRCRAVRKVAEWLRLDSRIESIDVGKIGQVKKLSTEEQVGELSLECKTSLMPAGLAPRPTGTCDEEDTSIVAKGAGAEIGKVVGIEIDHLSGVVAVWLDLRHGDDERLGTKIHPEVGVGSIGVWGDDELVLGGGDGFRTETVLKVAR